MHAYMGHLFTEPIDQCSDFSVQSSGIDEESCTWMRVWSKGFIRKRSIGSICSIPLHKYTCKYKSTNDKYFFFFFLIYKLVIWVQAWVRDSTAKWILRQI